MNAPRPSRPASLLATLAVLAPTALGQSAPDPVARPAGGALRVEIRGPLDRSTQSHLKRGIDEAAARGARLVIDIDTPGGEVDLMWQMARAIQRASDQGVESIAWVNDQALSAGSLVAMACDLLYMRSTATLGSALPVQLTPTGLAPVSEDEQVKEKLLSSYRAEFRSIANHRGRPGILAEAMVDPGVEVVEVEYQGERRFVSDREYDDLRARGEQPRFLRTVVARDTLLNVSGEEALELGIADGLVDSEEELANTLGLPAGSIEGLPRTRSEDLASLFYAWTPLLLILAFVLAYVEFKMPGFGIAGIAAIACFVLVLTGRWLVGLADVPHLLLILAGIGLLAVELFLFPGTLWAGISGALLLLAGLIWSFAGANTGFEYALDREILLNETVRVMTAAFVALLATWSLGRFLPRTPFFGRLVLDGGGSAEPGGAMPETVDRHARVARVGAQGRALTALRPVGKVVLLEDESLEFEARSDGASLEPGRAVVVREVSPAGRLLVDPLPSAPPTPGDASPA